MKVIPETYLMKVIPETYLMKVIPETYLTKVIPGSWALNVFITINIRKFFDRLKHIKYIRFHVYSDLLLSS
jgi:hypothetical protein